MLKWLADRVVKDAWLVVLGWTAIALVLPLIALTGLGGRSLFDRLDAGALPVTGSQSAEGQQILDSLAGDGETVTLLVRGVDIRSSEAQKAVAQTLSPAHKDLVALVGEQNVLDPFVVPGMLEEPAAVALASSDLDGFLLVVTVDPNGEAVADPNDAQAAEERAALVAKVESRLSKVPAELAAVSQGATGIVSDDGLQASAVRAAVRADLLRAAAIALPLLLLVMALLLRSARAALAPLLGAVASAAGSLGILYVGSLVTGVPAITVSIASAAGLAVSIGLGFLMTWRVREAVAALTPSTDTPEAGRRRRRRGRRDAGAARAAASAVARTGRTIALCSAVIIIPMAGLTLLRASALRTTGLAVIAIVIVSAAAALTLVPAVLVIVGSRRGSRPALPQALRLRLARTGVPRSGVFAWTAHQVRRMPWVVLVGAVAILLVLASPVRGLHLLISSSEMLPASSDQRTFTRVLSTDYVAAAQQDATLIIASTGDPVTAFINNKVAKAAGVTSILQTATAGSYTVIYLDLDGSSSSHEAEDAVAAIRALDAPADAWVTGQAASQLDFRLLAQHRLPWILGAVVLLAMAVMVVSTGSLIVPLIAASGAALSLGAAAGVLVWVFQEGHLSGLLSLARASGIDGFVVLTVLAAGLALTLMDGLVVLKRVQDAWSDDDAGGSLAHGLQHSGPVAVATATAIVASLVSFLACRLVVAQEMAIALGVVAVADALVVRGLLVPAAVSILGRWTWWAPRRVRELSASLAVQSVGD